ncbi:helix-turn-helix domain-containing protein [Nocardia sp. NBC_01327]|uniref:helix-turn-helix domain-containing protein n=1 Tax=Nocardia sp. NBC_01327 TaxID=2903593 RepID=UPI002E12CD53|nr:XRE family transcriptional regulator [Nocardia sp. NBC_01327]
MTRNAGADLTDDRSNLSRDVGVNVRARRTALGLSVAELARQSGVSGPFLSQLETGRCSISIPTLYRVAEALNTTPNELLPQAPGSVLVTRAGHGPMIEATESEHPQRPRLLTRRGPGVALEAFHYRIEAAEDEQQWYQHRGEDFVHVIAGAILVEFQDGRTVELATGDSLHHDGDVPHRWKLLGEGPAEAVIVVTIPPGAQR